MDGASSIRSKHYHVSEKLSDRCLTSSPTIAPDFPALVRVHAAVAFSAVGGSLEMRHRLRGLFRSDRVGELKGGGGKAGGAGGFPAGWQPAFRDGQDGHPPSAVGGLFYVALRDPVVPDLRGGWKK
jgi:hypothetical protein